MILPGTGRWQPAGLTEGAIEATPPRTNQSRSRSLIPVLDRVWASTRLTITAQ